MRRGGGGRSRPVRWGRWARARVVLVVTALVATVGVVGAEPAAAAHAAAEVRWLQVSAGTDHTCAIRERSPGAGVGTLWCWGYNYWGQLGIGSRNPEFVTTPTQVGRDADWSFVTAGQAHTCALKPGALGIGGMRYCWGYKDNWASILFPWYILSPTKVDNGWSSLSAGSWHTCGIGHFLRILTCSGNNSAGQGGVGHTEHLDTPTLVGGGLRTWRMVSAGPGYTCAIAQDQQRYCWGDDRYGDDSRLSYRLGLGDVPGEMVLSPTAIPDDGSWSWVTTGDRHACGISINRRAYCWGSNRRGQLGLGDYNVGPDGCCMKVPSIRISGTSWKELHAGNDFTCGLTTNGNRLCWGANDFGQLALGDFRDRRSPEEWMGPIPNRPEGPIWESISIGGQHGCGIQKNGRVYCWGSNWRGQVGIGEDRNEVSTPAFVS